MTVVKRVRHEGIQGKEQVRQDKVIRVRDYS